MTLQRIKQGKVDELKNWQWDGEYNAYLGKCRGRERERKGWKKSDPLRKSDTKWTKLIQMNITTITPNRDHWILAPCINFRERKRNWRNRATTFILPIHSLSLSLSLSLSAYQIERNLRKQIMDKVNFGRR